MTSSTTARAGGSSSSRFTRRSVSMWPPSDGQLGDECVDDGRTPPLDDRPAEAVSHGGEEPGEDAGERRRERQHGMGGRAGHERPRLFGMEPVGHALGGGEPAQPEPGGYEGVGGHGAH